MLFLDAIIKLHKLLWKDDDLMEQDSLLQAQEIIDAIIRHLTKKGSIKIKQLENGYISSIRKIKKEHIYDKG